MALFPRRTDFLAIMIALQCDGTEVSLEYCKSEFGFGTFPGEELAALGIICANSCDDNY